MTGSAGMCQREYHRPPPAGYVGRRARPPGVDYASDMASEDRQHSGWSLQIGRILGIPVRVHFTFLLLVVWYAVDSTSRGNLLFLSIAFLLLVFGSVLLHELGHAVAAARFGVRTRDIVLYPIGGIARLENIPGGLAELWIALAGPLVNLGLAGGLAGLLWLTPIDWQLSATLVTGEELVTRLLIANGMLFVFNLIPAFPMDGGRILRAALTLGLSQQRATEVAAAVGQSIAVLFGLLGLVTGNLLLILIAVFVFLGATQEAMYYRQRALILGKKARVAMITRFEELAPQHSLVQAAEHLLATHQQDFPVVDAWHRVVGVLSRARLLEGLARAGGAAAVLEVMERDPPRVDVDADLELVLRLLRSRPGCPVMVLEQERLVGMITLDNLGEYIEVARRGGGGTPAEPAGPTVSAERPPPGPSGNGTS